MSKKTTKTVETFIGTSKREEEEPKLTYIKTNKTELNNTSSKSLIAPVPKEKAQEKSKEKAQEKSKEKAQEKVQFPEIEIVEKPRLSPLRTRLKERTEKCAPVIIEEPVKNKSKTEKSKVTKPKKEKDTNPVVYKSPIWFKSPRVKVIKPIIPVLKELLRKDPRYTEREVEKIISDHS